MTKQAKPAKPIRPMWLPPMGWYKAELKARQAKADQAYLNEDNGRRRQYGLPTYGP